MSNKTMRYIAFTILILLLLSFAPATTQSNPPTLTYAETQAIIANSASCSFLTNSGFESGPVGWNQSGSGQVWELPDEAWNGDWLAWQCGYDSCADRLWQEIDFTGYGEPILFFFWKLESQDIGRPYDVFSGYILDEAGGPLHGLYTYTNLTLPKDHWNWESYDLSGLGLDNTTFQLSFTGVTDLSRPTSFYLDDVVICGRTLEMVYLPVVMKEGKQ